MPTWSDILDQPAAVDQLRRAYAADRLPHGMVFAGPVGVGKGTTAAVLATLFLCERPRGDQACGTCDSCLGALRRGVDERSATGGFKIADVVHHPRFGVGTVERAERDLVTVLFPSVGYKTLLASAVSHSQVQIA